MALIEESLGRPDTYHPYINSKDFQTIKIQMMALGLMKIANAKATNESQMLFWKLSPKGIQLMNEICVIRADSTEHNNVK